MAPIRYDVINYKDYLDYKINKIYGFHSSIERELYDLIKGTLIKYCIQLMLGDMQGAFLAYHNTQ